MKKGLSTAIVIGLVFVALQAGFGARAAPSHVVAGFVLTPGPVGLAEYANAVIILITNNSGLLVIQNQLDPPVPPDPPTYAQDIGGPNYNWDTTDQAIVILEARYNMNGYPFGTYRQNYTTAVNAQLTMVEPQEMPDATLEAYPTPSTAVSGQDVTVSWTAMPLTPNIVSYGVYRAANTWQGPYSLLGTVTHVAGLRSYNDVSLPAGNYYYKLSVNYRKNVTGTVVNETVGRSEWVAATVTTPPMITNELPAHGATGVPENADIVITFSKAMDLAPGQSSVNINPWLPHTDTWTGISELTVTHPLQLFTQGDTYQVRVAANDTFGNALVPNPNPAIPNPFSFTVITTNPQIATVSPGSGSTNVDRTADIVIAFTKAMDTTAGEWGVNINPQITYTSVWTGGDTLTLSHATPFTLCQKYWVQVAANDTAGNPLVGGPVPNPWDFTANCAPTVSITSTLAGQCFPNGAPVNIAWGMVDETPEASLSVVVTYNYTGGQGPITGPTPGLTSYAWTPPGPPAGLNAPDVYVRVNSTDEWSDLGTDTEGPFEVDTTAPSVSSSGPSGSVPVMAKIYVNFSEDMNETSVQSAFSVAPSVTPTFYWATPKRNLEVTATLAPNTNYVVTVSIAAKDDCGSGNPLPTQYTFSFTTRGKMPKAPVLDTPASADITTNSVTLTWQAVTQYTDNSDIPSGTTITYRLYRVGTPDVLVCTKPSTETLSCTDTGLAAKTSYSYYAVAEVAGETSGHSNTVSIITKEAGPPPPPSVDYTWLIIAIIIIVVILLLLMIVMMKRKKPEEVVPEEEKPLEEEVPAEEAPAEEAPAEEVPAEEAPPEEAPPEEAPPEGEGGEGGGESPPPA